MPNEHMSQCMNQVNCGLAWQHFCHSDTQKHLCHHIAMYLTALCLLLYTTAWRAKSTAGLGVRHTSVLYQVKGCYDIPSFCSNLDHSLSCLLAFYRCTKLCARLSVHYATISVYSQHDPYSEWKHLQATDHKQVSVLSKLLCFVPHVQRPHVRLQKLPLVIKDSLHLPKDLCRAKEAVKCLQGG